MGKLRLGEYELKTSIERDRFSELRKSILDAGKNWRMRQLNYEQIHKFDTTQSYFDKFIEIHISLSRKISEESARFVVLHGIYDFSIDDVFNELMLFPEKYKSSGFEKAINVFSNAARVSREDFLNAVLNKSELKISLWDVRNPLKLSEILESEYIYDFINLHIIDVCEYCSFLVAEIINRKKLETYFRSVKKEDEYKALSILQNIKKEVIVYPEIGRALLAALSMHPYNGDIWREWIDRFGDSDGSVGESAAAFHVDEVDVYKQKLVSQEKEKLVWTTAESCAQSLKSLEKLYSRLGLPFENERKRINENSDKIERDSRTFKGVLYASPSVANAARAADNRAREEIYSRTFEGVIYNTLEEAVEARSQKKENEILMSRADSGWGWSTLAFRRKFSTNGRSCRKEFWWLVLLFFLSFSIFGAIVPAIDKMIIYGEVISVILTIPFLLYAIYVIILLIFVQIRRFHDLDKSGLFILLNLIPYIGWLITLIMMMLPGTNGDNRYGPDPSRR